MKNRASAGVLADRWLVLACLMGLVSRCSFAEPLPLKRAVQPALSQGTVVGVATADRQHAFACYRENIATTTSRNRRWARGWANPGAFR